MKNHLFLSTRALLLAASVLLGSCGGGGGDPAPVSGGSGGSTVVHTDSAGSSGSTPYTGPGTTAGAGMSDTDGGGSGSDTAGTGGGSAGGSAGEGATGVAGGSGGPGSGGTGVGGGDSGTGVAGGVGSGGTGVSGDGSGVGSGGTGVSAVGIGSVDGFGSVIVNDTHWNIDKARVEIRDDPRKELKLGMSVRVAGTVTADLSRGTATSVVSAAELRGPVSGLDVASGSFEVLGILVLADESTVFEGFDSLADVKQRNLVQVYGLPGEFGQLRATRIEQRNAAAPIVTGAISQLNTAARTFRLGSLTVSYANASFGAVLPPGALAEGQVVRVRAAQAPGNGPLVANSVQSWYDVGATPNGTRLSLAGLVTDFTAQSNFKVQGVQVNGSQTNVSGGPARALENGVRVEVSGTLNNGVLILDKLRLRGPKSGGPPETYSVTGRIGQFSSLAAFRVQGQLIDASKPGLVVNNGTASQAARGRKVTVTGTRMRGDVLIADTLTFND